MLMGEAGERLEVQCGHVGDPALLHLLVNRYRRPVRDGVVSFIEGFELSEGGSAIMRCVYQKDAFVCAPIDCPPEEKAKFFRRNRLCE